MHSIEYFKEKLDQVNDATFEEFALELFEFQSSQNPVYRAFLEHSNKLKSIDQISQIPFLPIEFFKTHVVKTGNWQTAKIFKSSGTTLSGRSQHYLDELTFYHNTSLKWANQYFGELNKFHLSALLPSYLEAGDSSLVEMVNHFMKHTQSDSAFYIDQHDQLRGIIRESAAPILLIGVSYALLEFGRKFKDIDLSKHIIVETGGMKGRSKEMTKQEFYEELRYLFHSETIHSEYGMTELLSQAYGANGLLKFPSWAKPLIRDLNDPFSIKTNGSGALNVIDLANVHSCAFVETKDLAILQETGQFEILGRMDNSDIRGCSLLI